MRVDVGGVDEGYGMSVDDGGLDGGYGMSVGDGSVVEEKCYQ